MTNFARIAFAALVLSTFGAFFVAQRLKQSPRVVRALTITTAFSPNNSGALDRARIRFELKRSDEVTVSLVDEKGEAVRRLVDNGSVTAGKPTEYFWDGRTDGGAVAPDGSYRVRVTLRREGRSVFFAKSIVLDTTPPRPVVFVTSPKSAKPGGSPVTRPGTAVKFRFVGPTRLPTRVYVYCTDDGAPKLVRSFKVARGKLSAIWDGRDDGGVIARPGSYLIAVRMADAVLNAATSPVLAPPTKDRPRGRPGVTLRIVSASPPSEPVRAGALATFKIDALGSSYRWQIRRLGSLKPLKGKGFSGRSNAATLRIRAPKAISGLYFLDLTVGGYVTKAPFAVLGAGKRAILVVLPTISWQGRNPVADTDDGLPNTLLRGGPVSLSRAYAPLPGREGVPIGFSAQEGPLLDFLDQNKVGYELTTDVALSRGKGPSLGGHRGVVLAGNSRWNTPKLRSELLAYVRAGGRVFSLGTVSLRRTVELSGNSLSTPSLELALDAFGARIAKLKKTDPVEILAFANDELGLFDGTDGLFTGFSRFEQTDQIWPGAKIASAAGAQEGQPLIVGAQLGKGIVMRTGLPDWSSRLADDFNVATVTRRAWALLSR
ncbi:MAG: FlgD immunoglobulin-like domain containing protein [Actinomycetota bacterium]